MDPLFQTIFSCPFCKRIYNNPRLLPCEHSLCTECMLKSCSNGSIKCPECQVQSPILSPDSVPRSDILTFAIESLGLDNKSFLCQICEAKEAGIFCEDCNLNICEDCSSQRIHNIPTWRNHRFKEVRKSRLKECAAHAGKESDLYCKKCKTLMCLKCAVLQHKDHEVQDIKTAKEGLFVEFERNPEIKTAMEKIPITMKLLENQQILTEKNFSGSEKEIASIQSLMFLLQKRKSVLEQKLKRKKEKFARIMFGTRTKVKDFDRHKTIYQVISKNAQKVDDFTHLQIFLQKIESKLRKFNQEEILTEAKLPPLVSFQSESDSLIEKINSLRITEKFRFTTLGFQGRKGPTSLSGYRNTPLDSKVKLGPSGIQEFTIPQTGVYFIKAAGAAGGAASQFNTQRVSGAGAIVHGLFELKKGTILGILVGQKGSDGTGGGGGGGGGTFVVHAQETSGNVTMFPLLIAGGGGGGGFERKALDAVLGSIGDKAGLSLRGKDGPGAGGSFSQNAQPYHLGGRSFIDGGEGGKNTDQVAGEGGFGGGGAGRSKEGGAGGGYSGGSLRKPGPQQDEGLFQSLKGVFRRENNVEVVADEEGLGAGCFNAGKNQNLQMVEKSVGDGYVFIKRIH